jgi:hypothetical protein
MSSPQPQLVPGETVHVGTGRNLSDFATSQELTVPTSNTLRHLLPSIRNVKMRDVDENLRMFVYMVRHNPLVVVGLGLIGVAGALWFHALLQLERVGLGSSAVFKFGGNWGIPVEYLKVRRNFGWPAWPAYFLWPCFVVGVVCLVVGVFRL